MRITNKMLSNTFLSDLQRNLNNLRKIQQQTASGKNFSKPSDDPFNVVRAMQLQTDINANAQYKTNIVNSLNFMDTTDTALNQIGNVLTGIRENLIKGGNAAYGSDERGKIKDEINQRISQIAQLLNTNFQGDYIFGGTRGLTKPVTTEKYGIESVPLEVNFTDVGEWNKGTGADKTITFSITDSSGKVDEESITLDSIHTNIDAVVNDLNSKIQDNSNLRNKITVSKSTDGESITFISENSSDDIRIKDTTVTEQDMVSLKENLDGKTITFNPDEWNGTVTVNFNVDDGAGTVTDVPISIDCSTLSKPLSIGSVRSALENAIKGTKLEGKLSIADDGDKLTFSSSYNIKITSASTLSLSSLEGKKFPSESTDNENISIKYLGTDGSPLEYVPGVETSNVDLTKWNGQFISFSGTTSDTPPVTYAGTITLDGNNKNVDDLVKDINTKIQGNAELKDKITAVKTDDGNVKFLAVNSRDNIKIRGIYSDKITDINIGNWKDKIIDFGGSTIDGNTITSAEGTIDLTSIPPETDPVSTSDLVDRINDRIQGNSVLKDKIIASDDGSGNIKFIAAITGDSINSAIIEPTQSSKTSGITLSNWGGKSITFSGSASGTITLDGPYTNVDDLVKDINAKIEANTTGLEGKITAVKTDDGNIKFIASGSSDNIKIDSTTTVSDLSSVSGKKLPTAEEDEILDKQFSSVEMDNIDSKRKAEVSQGVVVEYNACATDVLQYGSNPDDNTAALLDRIVHHLAGQAAAYTKADGTSYTASDAGVVKDGNGNYYVWADDENAATSALTNEDLSDIDEASKQLLKVRSEVGAKANRMESMSSQNDDTKINMTDILSKTEDIDITEKTIEYYTMITVYQASLQTSARVIQPTLMDYIS